MNRPDPGGTGGAVICDPTLTSLDAPETSGNVSWAEATLVALAFAALGLWRVIEVFVRPGYSLSHPSGDGIGGTGWMFDHATDW